MDDRKQAIARHSDLDIAVLTVIPTPVLASYGEGVVKDEASDFESYAVNGKILGRFGIVPFKIVVFHIYYGLPVYSRAFYFLGA